MFLKLSAKIFILAALAAPAAAAAYGPGQREDPRAAPSAPRAEPEAPVELICRSVAVAGETESAPMVCMTAADWRRAEQ